MADLPSYWVVHNASGKIVAAVEDAKAARAIARWDGDTVTEYISKPMVDLMVSAATCEEAVKVQVARQEERERIVNLLRFAEVDVPILLAKSAADFVAAKLIQAILRETK